MKCESIKENPCSDLAEGCQWYTIQTAYFDQQYTLYSNRHFPFVYTLTSKFVCISDGMRHFGCKYVCLKLLLSHDVRDMNIVTFMYVFDPDMTILVGWILSIKSLCLNCPLV